MKATFKNHHKQKNTQLKNVSVNETYTHAQLFYSLLDFVWDYPGEPAPER